MNWQRYWRRNKRDILRLAIVVGSAIVVGFLAMLIADALESDYTFYSPHDETRRQSLFPFSATPEHYPIYTFEDEHKQALERI